MKFNVNGNVIVCHDWLEWNRDELDKWCKNNQCQLQGWTVVVPDEKAISLFVLRWS